MTDAAPASKKRGPRTPEGKARSAMNALRHGLRARCFALLPEEDPAEWAEHLADLRAGLGPVDAAEEKLVTALAVAMWKEIRADRQEAEVLAAIPPLGPGRPCGGDLQQPQHALSLSTAVRYASAAGMATQRAQRAFLAHRKAKVLGLVVIGPVAPAEAANQNCTNEFSGAGRDFPGQVVEPAPPRPAAAKPSTDRAGKPRAGRAQEAELDDEAWLASLPVVEDDPEREAERRRAADEGRAQGGPAHHRPCAARRHRALSGGRRSRGLRGMVRPPAQAAAGRDGVHDRGRRGGGQLGHPPQPALGAGQVSGLLPPAGAGASVRARGGGQYVSIYWAQSANSCNVCCAQTPWIVLMGNWSSRRCWRSSIALRR